jgi:hypothetical protein
MRHDAWVVLEDGERHECALSDISGIGARINVADTDPIPDGFLLLLAANGAARRRCRVIWRKPRELGVKFETRLDDRIRAAAIPKSKSGGAVAAKQPTETDA